MVLMLINYAIGLFPRPSAVAHVGADGNYSVRGSSRHALLSTSAARIAATIILTVGAVVVQHGIAADLAQSNWLGQQNGSAELNNGRLTTNADELRRFVATGRPIRELVHGAMRIIIREGIFEESDGGPGSLVEPASVEVSFRNRRLVAAKGYRLGADLAANGLKIENWNGDDGCAIRRWTLTFVGERLQLSDEQWRRIDNQAPCVPPSPREGLIQ